HALGAVAIAPVDVHAGPFGGQGARDLRADAAAASGDDRSLAGEFEIHSPYIAPRRRWNRRRRGDRLLPIMATMDARQLQVFAAVVRAGSFTGAALALRTQKAHVSRVVSRLERELGVRLLSRTTRSVAVTDTGHDLYVRATGILAALDDARDAMLRSQREPQGALKVTCGVEFGLLVVGRWIDELLRRYPKVRVEADFSNRVADLVQEGFDVAVRVGALADSSLAVRKLGEVSYALYASPDYLAGRPAPAAPAELVAHDLVMFSPRPPPRWRLRPGGDRVAGAGPARPHVHHNPAAPHAP